MSIDKGVSSVKKRRATYKKGKYMIKLVAFDLDGTLTQHKTKLSDSNRAVLDELSKKYRLLMVGAGTCKRIFEQMDRYPIDVIGNYGMQFARYDEESAAQCLERDTVLECERESVAARIEELRKKYGFTEYRGNSVEYHNSGCVTFPILGTEARQEDKLAFDPTRKKRRAIYKEVADTFPEYTVFVGGSSSFDMAPKPYNKYYALDLYAREMGYSHSEVVFVGDDYGIGGNDEPVYLSDFGFIKINDYRKLREAVAHLF